MLPQQVHNSTLNPVTCFQALWHAMLAIGLLARWFPLLLPRLAVGSVLFFLPLLCLPV